MEISNIPIFYEGTLSIEAIRISFNDSRNQYGAFEMENE